MYRVFSFEVGDSGPGLHLQCPNHFIVPVGVQGANSLFFFYLLAFKRRLSWVEVRGSSISSMSPGLPRVLLKGTIGLSWWQISAAWLLF